MQAQKDVINLNFTSIRGFSTNKLILLYDYDVPEKYLKNNKCCKAYRYVIKVMNEHREGEQFLRFARTKGWFATF
jgi:hypothetical protein